MVRPLPPPLVSKENSHINVACLVRGLVFSFVDHVSFAWAFLCSRLSRPNSPNSAPSATSPGSPASVANLQHPHYSHTFHVRNCIMRLQTPHQLKDVVKDVKGWEYKEDVRGKPGYIATKPGSTLLLQVGPVCGLVKLRINPECCENVRQRCCCCA